MLYATNSRYLHIQGQCQTPAGDSEILHEGEAQLAAIVEGIGVAPIEVMTYGTVDRADERWLQRTLSQASTQLASVRERIFTFAQLQRHHLVLDLNAASGLLTWEAIRQVPEGGVYASVRNSSNANALIELAAALPETMRPIIFTASVAQILNAFASNGHCVQVVVEQYLTPMHISDHFIKRLFTANPNRPSYADRLSANLTSQELEIIKSLFTRYLLNQSVNWSSTVAFFLLSG